MGRVNNISTQVQNVKTLEDLRRFLGAALDAIVTQFNGKVDFIDNVRAAGPYDVTLAANEVVKVQHTLGRTPIGFLTLWNMGLVPLQRPDATLYPWNETQIWVTCFTDNNSSILVV